MNKTNELGSEPIGRLLAKYSIPAVIAMLVNAVYNIVDRVFIGQIVGEDALAGLTIAFPVMITIFAFANLIGAGGAALMSIKLGEKNSKGASQVFANMLGLGILVTIIASVSLYFNLETVLNLFGASPEIISYAINYMQIILLGFIFQMISYLLSSAVRSEGMPMMGIQQGIQPIIGYNHGAGKIDRTYKTLSLGIIVGVIFSSIVFILLQAFPQAFISMFLDSTSETMQVAVTGLRIYVLMLPLLSINIFGIAFYQSTAKSKISFVLGLLRKIIFLIPAIMILSNNFGLIGTWIALPVADGSAILITGLALAITYRKDKKEGQLQIGSFAA